MTDYSVNAPRARAQRGSRLEYKVYFALIFLFALPFAALGWAFDLVRRTGVPDRGPVARAWGEARAITPMIFLA